MTYTGTILPFYRFSILPSHDFGMLLLLLLFLARHVGRLTLQIYLCFYLPTIIQCIVCTRDRFQQEGRHSQSYSDSGNGVPLNVIVR